MGILKLLKITVFIIFVNDYYERKFYVKICDFLNKFLKIKIESFYKIIK